MMGWAGTLKRYTNWYKFNKPVRFFCNLSLQNIPLKAACHILIFLLFNSSLFAQQYYIRGEVKDESGNALQNVKIIQYRSGYVFKTGFEGTFGIVSNQLADTFSFSLDGYRAETRLINANEYTSIKLKLLPASTISVRRDKLASLTRNLEKEEQKMWFTGE